jgi:hypothetical protein
MKAATSWKSESLLGDLATCTPCSRVRRGKVEVADHNERSSLRYLAVFAKSYRTTSVLKTRTVRTVIRDLPAEHFSIEDFLEPQKLSFSSDGSVPITQTFDN